MKAAVEELLRDGARIAGSWMGKPSSTVVHLWRYAIPLGAGVEGGFLRSANDDKLYLIGDGLQGGVLREPGSLDSKQPGIIL